MSNTANDLFVPDAPIVPEGGLDVGDLTTGEEFSDSQRAEQTTEEEGAPTTESQSAAAEGNAAEPAKAEPQGPNKLKFRAKIDREESDVELDESELPGVYQKAMNHDRVTAKLAKSKALVQSMRDLSCQLGYESAEAMIEGLRQNNRKSQIEALVAGGTAKEIAEFYVDQQAARKMTSIEEEEHEPVQEPKPTKEDQEAELLRDYRKQLDELFTARPELRGHLAELPKEVSDAVVAGTPLRAAYAEWEGAQLKAERDRIRRERDALAQRSEATTRAPVRGVTGGGKSSSEAEDPFLKGLNRDW